MVRAPSLCAGVPALLDQLLEAVVLALAYVGRPVARSDDLAPALGEPRVARVVQDLQNPGWVPVLRLLTVHSRFGKPPRVVEGPRDRAAVLASQRQTKQHL